MAHTHCDIIHERSKNFQPLETFYPVISKIPRATAQKASLPLHRSIVKKNLKNNRDKLFEMRAPNAGATRILNSYTPHQSPAAEFYTGNSRPQAADGTTGGVFEV